MFAAAQSMPPRWSTPPRRGIGESRRMDSGLSRWPPIRLAAAVAEINAGWGCVYREPRRTGAPGSGPGRDAQQLRAASADHYLRR
jgi:hypothetical protein